MLKKNQRIAFYFFLNGLILVPASTFSQKLELLTPGPKVSLRGLSAVNNKTVWVSGSSGTVGRSLDGGITWKWMTVKGYDKTDFRDIEAFDSKTAVIMGIAAPAYILKTTDGGDNWKMVYENKDTGMFLDAMEFWNEQSGIVIGDPINNRFFIARTFDGGNTWRSIPEENKPMSDKGEACFASSGTNVRKLNKKEAVFISGGLTAHMYIRENRILLPVIQGKETTGANSVAVKNSKILVVVGGDFNTRDSTTKNCVITRDAGKTFRSPAVPPHGYRSCVEYLGKKNWISCGLNGVDFSKDDADNWNLVSKEGFHVCRKAKKGNVVFFAGSGGRTGKLIVDP